MKETCCDFCGRECDYGDLIIHGKAHICFTCKQQQKEDKPRGKEVKGDMFRNSKLS